jgi:hypothetical protein
MCDDRIHILRRSWKQQILVEKLVLLPWWGDGAAAAGSSTLQGREAERVGGASKLIP